MNVLLLLAHAIEEFDQVRLLSELGYDVFSIGGYSEPAHPGVDIRPALPDAPDHPELRAACHERRVEWAEQGRSTVMTMDGERDAVDAAKADIPDAVFDWADVIIVHHFEHTWLWPQWKRLRDKRVVWRTVGQSVEGNERMMAPLTAEGLQIVRYSPKERNIPGYAGEDALIRFYKDPDEWTGWTGEEPVVINITQRLAQRDPFTNYGFWQAATEGLNALALGPGSEEIGGPGELTYDEMRGWLRKARCYLYTGTQPASYTLGLIEAMMTGIPVVSIAPQFMRIFPYSADLYEGAELAGNVGDAMDGYARSDEQVIANTRSLLSDKLRFWESKPNATTSWTRERAIAIFGKERIGAEWADFLG